MARVSKTGGKAGKKKPGKTKTRKPSPAKGRKTVKAKRAKAKTTKAKTSNIKTSNIKTSNIKTANIKRRAAPRELGSVSDFAKELKEARERQTATADILRIISRSVAHAAPVFDAILESCQRQFDPYDAAVYLVEGDRVRGVARRGPGVGDWGTDSMPLAGSSTGLAIAQRRPLHFPDLADKEDLPEDKRDAVRLLGGMSVLYAPIISDSRGVGSLVVTRQPRKPFTESEIEFIQSFADQAAIAIENARLFDEVQNKTRDLGAALEQQTATADVLKVISRSAFDLDSVMHTLARSAAELCVAGLCGLYIREGDFLVCRGYTTISKEQEDFVRHARIPAFDSNFATTRVLSSGEIANIGDFKNDRSVATQMFREKLGFKSLLIVPLMREGQGIGLFVLGRDRIGQFSPRHVELVQTFADQAVIAIENARLFDEVQARTRDLGEALEQQTATSEVLAVISRSPSDLNPVLEAISDTAARLCGSEQTMFFRYDGNVFRILASWNFPPEVHEMLERRPLMPGHPSAIGRAGASLKPVCIPDVLADPAYGLTGEQSRARYRATLAVPLLREGRLIGALSLNRSEPGAFTEKQIELVATFADQAVIAIENVRLFDEVQAKTSDLEESLQQQIATADVLKVISRSAFDLQAVLTTLVKSALTLCNAPIGTFFLRDGDGLRLATQVGCSPELVQYFHDNPIPLNQSSGAGRAFSTGKVVHFPDVLADPDYRLSEVQRLGEYRSLLAVPLLREQETIGVFSLSRTQPEPFSQRQIELVATFADQAVIAIENTRLFNETKQALAYQTGSSNVLRVIASSPTDVEPVLKAIVESARELCEANDAVVLLKDAEHLRFSAHSGPIPVTLDKWPIGRNWTAGRAFVDQKPVHVHDMLSAEGAEFPDARAMGQSTGATVHTVLSVPLLRGEESIGAILLRRTEVRPFNDKQINLLSTFADQAVIAIQNARQFNETREALERQTATAEILRVISQSPTEVQPVFDAIVQTAVRLTRCDLAFVFRCDGTTFSPAAAAGTEGPLLDLGPSHLPIDPAANFPSRAIVEKKNVHLPDWSLIELPEHERQIRALIGVSSALFLPLLRDDECIGVLGLAGKRANIFGKSEIALAESFRDQAVIAIENVRLFNETREALERQTATAEILKVIASSPDDVQPVFQAIAERSNHLVGGFATTVVSIVADVVHLSAFTSTTPAADAALKAFYPRPLSGFTYSDAVRRGEIYGIVDAEVELAGQPDELTIVRRRGWRSALWVPLVLEGEAIGAIGVTRVERGPFADHHVDMLKTFADQAVIAISNVNLFRQVQERTHDLEESLQQQTATSEVLQVISRSVFDLKTVLQTLLESAAGLCDASICILFQSHGDLLHVGASYGGTPEFVEYLSNHPHRFDRDTVAGRAAVERRTIHIPDIAGDTEYGLPQSIKLGGWQSIIGVPLLRDGEVLGVLDLARPVAGPFTPRQIQLIETFADQAVIAIENARLFDEVQQRTKELAASLDNLRTAQDRLVQTEKLASLGQLTAGIAHEIKNPLNFVNNFSALSSELVDELDEALAPVAFDPKTRDEVGELTAMLKSNLEKVVQHGKRADSIVKNMLLHSRDGSGEHRPADINALVEESLNLAYHGARAEKSAINIKLAREFDPEAGAAELYPQEITRALLNFIANGFYAAIRRKSEAADETFEPTLWATTKNLGKSVQIRIRDNGTGIPPEVKEKMFNPFFTTKPAGEGTGLGLSMSHDIIVKQHGGRIDVETEPGVFTEFIITLPRHAAASPA